MEGFNNINGNLIHETAIIHPSYVVMGTGNIIGAYCVIGEAGEQRGKDPKDFKGKVVIGDNNRISEHVTIQRPYEEGAKTKINDNNFIMAHCHLGHDVVMGSNNELCTGVIVGGYATITQDVQIKLGAIIRNRIFVSCGSVVGMGSVVTKDVEPYTTVYGNPARVHE